jgi:hypothetical protein
MPGLPQQMSSEQIPAMVRLIMRRLCTDKSVGEAGLSAPNEENIVNRPAMSGRVPVKERGLAVEYLIFLPVRVDNVP